MAKTELIDSHVSLDQCRKAVEALHVHETKKKEKFEEGQLLPAKEQNVWLNVTVKAIPSGHKLKPVKIPIVHPLVDPRTSPVCLITKDPQREYKDLLETHNIKFISRVVGIEKLKGKFKPFEARRMLLKENGMFLADERIIPLLPKLLGSKWFEAKKQPIPVCLTRKDLKGELERAISSTYMNQNQGTCTSIKVGKMSQKPSQILDNIKTALPAVANAIKGGWDNIQSLNIKTNSSVSLPIWSCTLDATEGGRWHGIEAASDDEEADVADGSDSDEEDSDGEATKAKKAPVSKGKKRPSSSDEEEDEAEDQPKKKVKGADGAPSTKGKGKSAPSPKAATKSVDTTTPTKAEPVQSKKRKTPESSSSSAKPTPPSSVPISSGKKGPKTKTAAAEATLPTESVSKVPESAGKKGKKALAPPSTQPPTSTPEAPQKKKKTAPVAQASDSAIPSTRAPSSSAEAPAAARPANDKSEKKKTSKKSQAAAVPVAAAVSAKVVKPILSKDEMKQKRSAGVGEKKKEIVAKSKGGKSAKNAVLGKKVAQV